MKHKKINEEILHVLFLGQQIRIAINMWTRKNEKFKCVTCIFRKVQKMEINQMTIQTRDSHQRFQYVKEWKNANI